MNICNIKYKGKLELYHEQGFEGPICIFNCDNLPGQYAWITLKEIKYIEKIVIRDLSDQVVYDGSLTFKRDIQYMMRKNGLYEFRPIEINEEDWYKYNNNMYSFEFESKFVIRNLIEEMGVPSRLQWSGNEDYEKNIEVLILEEGFSLYFREGDDYIQSYKNVKSIDKLTGQITYEDGKIVYITKV